MILRFISMSLLIFSAGRANPVSEEAFKKITDADQRRQIIEQAPPEQKKELKKLDLHLELLRVLGGEAELKWTRENEAAKARGFEKLPAIFYAQPQLWDTYIAGLRSANHESRITRDQQAKLEEELTKKRSVPGKNLPLIHSLVFHMAASPKALQLEKRAEKLFYEMCQWLVSDGINPYHFITKEELMGVDLQLNQILAEMKKMPTLTSEQAQKEYESLTEDKIQTGVMD